MVAPFTNDFLPDPQAYLRAGVPRPTSMALDADGEEALISRHDVDYRLPRDSAEREERTRSLTSLTKTEDRVPTGVTWSRSGEYLAYPRADWRGKGKVTSVERTPSGVLHVHRDNDGLFGGDRRSPRVDVATAVPVTIDHSVVLAGIDPAKFRPDDALFASVAIAIECAYVVESSMIGPHPHVVGASDGWELTTPVAIDHAVLRAYRTLADAMRPWFLGEAPLDRTDLLCAATAVVYRAPLYTTKPDAYRGLKNGLKVLTYGPVRNKTAARGRQEPERPARVELSSGEPGTPPAAKAAAAASAAAAGVLRQAYAQGGDFDADAEQLMRRAGAGAPDDLARVLVHILEDVMSNTDTTWRVGLLERAADLAEPLSRADAEHENLVSALLNLIGMGESNRMDAEIRHQGELALAALGHWGRWPEDASEEILADLAEDDDEQLARWYRASLTMAGVPEAVVDTEVRAFTDGTVTPSRERIEELRRTRP